MQMSHWHFGERCKKVNQLSLLSDQPTCWKSYKWLGKISRIRLIWQCRPLPIFTAGALWVIKTKLGNIAVSVFYWYFGWVWQILKQNQKPIQITIRWRDLSRQGTRSLNKCENRNCASASQCVVVSICKIKNCSDEDGFGDDENADDNAF